MGEVKMLLCVVKKVGCRYCKSVTLRTPDGAKVSPPITQRRTSHMYDQTATPPRLSANGEVTSLCNQIYWMKKREVERDDEA